MMRKLRALNPVRSNLFGPLIRGLVAGAWVNGVALVVQFALQYLLTHSMNISDYGTFAYVLSWSSVLVLIGALGSDWGLVRFAAAYAATSEWAKFAGVVRWSYRVTILTSTILALTLVLVTLLVTESGTQLRGAFLVAAALIPIWAVVNVRQSLGKALKCVVRARFPDVVVRPLIIIALLLCTPSGVTPPPAPLVMLYHALASICALFLGRMLVRSCIPAEAQRCTGDDRSEVSLWRTTAFQLAAIAAGVMFFGEIDKLFIGSFLTFRDVAVYALASRLAALTLFGMEAAGALGIPLISEYYASRPRAEFQALISRMVLLMFGVTVPLTVAMAMLGNGVLGLFGAQYQDGYGVLVILSCAQLFHATTSPASFALIMTGHERVMIAITATAIGVGGAACALGAHLGGIHGVATAILLTLMARNSWQVLEARRRLGVNVTLWSACAVQWRRWRSHSGEGLSQGEEI